MARPRTSFYDSSTEAAVLGVALRAPAAIDTAVAAGISETTFFEPWHSSVWSAITELHAKGGDVDPVTVAGWLRERQLLDMVADDGGELGPTGVARLVELESAHGYERSVPSYCTTLVAFEHDRWVFNRLHDACNGQFARHAEILADIQEKEAAWAAPDTDGVTVDLQARYDSAVSVLPLLAPRDDRETCLLYAPGINWLSTEPGKGKSMLALWWTAQEVKAGRRVVYFDFETYPEGIIDRLKQMGVTQEQIGLVDYVWHQGAWLPGERVATRDLLVKSGASLVVFDAVAGAMDAENLKENDNTDIEKWVGFFPTIAAHAGAAVLCIDHVKKDTEGRGRWPIGGQRKLGRADLGYALEMWRDAGLGETGKGKLIVTKDRWGGLAPHCVGASIKVVAEVSIVSVDLGDGEYDLSVEFAAPEGPPPREKGGPVKADKTWYMEQVSLYLEEHPEGAGTTEIRDYIDRKPKYVKDAVDSLLRDGHIVVCAKVGNTIPYRVLRPYRQPEGRREPAPDTRYEKDGSDDDASV